MFSNIIKKVSSKFILYGLPLFYFLVAVSFYLGTYDSAQIKITIVQIGGVALLCSWLIYKFEGDFFNNFRKNIIVLLPIILFLLSGLISFVQYAQIPASRHFVTSSSSQWEVKIAIFIFLLSLAIGIINIIHWFNSWPWWGYVIFGVSLTHIIAGISVIIILMRKKARKEALDDDWKGQL